MVARGKGAARKKARRRDEIGRIQLAQVLGDERDFLELPRTGGDGFGGTCERFHGAIICSPRGRGPGPPKRAAMVTAFILMNVERPRLRSIADDLLAIDGIAEVYSVAGPFDLVAIARVKEHEQLNDLVTEHVAALDGIVNTETLIAFRSFAKKDLGLLWDIGVD